MENTTKKMKCINYKFLHCSELGNPRAWLILEDENGHRFKATTATNSQAGLFVCNYIVNTILLYTMHTTKTGNIIVNRIEKLNK